MSPFADFVTSDPPCEWFVWIGAKVCDRCGRLPHEHKGVQELREGASPFGSGKDVDPWENVTWEEWEERARRRGRARERGAGSLIVSS